jgi:DNA-binding MarR family transcriptional regulator
VAPEVIDDTNQLFYADHRGPIEDGGRVDGVGPVHRAGGAGAGEASTRGAGRLSLRPIIGERGGIRPSEIAERRGVHPSLVTRQVRQPEDGGCGTDPADGRSCLLTLTPEGIDELHRLVEVGLDHVAGFVADWSSDEVRALTALLTRLEASKVAAGARAVHPRDRPSFRPRTAAAPPGEGRRP